MDLTDYTADYTDRYADDPHFQLGVLRAHLGLHERPDAFDILSRVRSNHGQPHLVVASILNDVIATLQDQLRSEVTSALTLDGATWSDVGDALGVSRQAAQQKYGRRRRPAGPVST